MRLTARVKRLERMYLPLSAEEELRRMSDEELAEFTLDLSKQLHGKERQKSIEIYTKIKEMIERMRNW